MFKFAVATAAALSSTGASAIYLTKDSLRGSKQQSDFPVPWNLQKPIAETLALLKEKVPGLKEELQSPKFALVQQLLMAKPEQQSGFQAMFDAIVDQVLQSEGLKKQVARENIAKAGPYLAISRALKEPTSQLMAIIKDWLQQQKEGKQIDMAKIQTAMEQFVPQCMEWLKKVRKSRSKSSSRRGSSSSSRGKTRDPPAYHNTVREDIIARQKMASGQGGQQVRKVVVFDFDQTISSIHVFHLLAKAGAASERGQVLKLVRESEGDHEFYVDLLGGEERVAQLGDFFSDLKREGAVLYVCSKGLVATVRFVLAKTGLLKHFQEPVFGRITDYLPGGGKGGKSSLVGIDREAANIPDEEFPEGVEHFDRLEGAEWRQKAILCQDLAQKWLPSLSYPKDFAAACMLVEDDQKEIQKGERAGIAVSYVEGGRGVGEKEMAEIKAWVNSSATEKTGQKQLSVEQWAKLESIMQKLMDMVRKLFSENPEAVTEMAKIINEQWPTFIEDSEMWAQDFFAFVEEKNFEEFVNKLFSSEQGAINIGVFRAEAAKIYAGCVKALEKAIPVMNAMIKSRVLDEFVAKISEELQLWLKEAQQADVKTVVLPVKAPEQADEENSVEDQAEREMMQEKEEENKPEKKEEKEKKNRWLVPTLLIVGVLLLAAGVVAFFMKKD